MNKSKLYQVKLALDMVLVSLVLFDPDIAIEMKIIIGILGFDYTFMCSERIDKLQQEEKSGNG
jgi:hypothetical protein